jgi:hypothetical protein
VAYHTSAHLTSLYCYPFYTTLSARGSFVPSGYFLKAVFLHSGQAVSRYSDPLYDLEPTRFPSFQLLSEPIDVFQGRRQGSILFNAFDSLHSTPFH